MIVVKWVRMVSSLAAGTVSSYMLKLRGWSTANIEVTLGTSLNSYDDRNPRISEV